MTSCYLSPGYDGHRCKGETWDKLKEVVAELKREPELLYAAVREMEPEWPGEQLRLFVGYYVLADDGTLCVEEEKQQVVQMASGGGEDRRLKEACRRAFCRLVIQRMHAECFEVSMVVA